MPTYQPHTRLTIDGTAREFHDRTDTAIGSSITGVVIYSGIEVSHIVADEGLSNNDLDALATEFGVDWHER